MTYSCFVLVDGTDFRIYKATFFSALCYSHKFNRVVVRYAVAVATHNGDIVVINRPFQVRDWPDNAVFWDQIIGMLFKRRGWKPTKISWIDGI